MFQYAAGLSLANKKNTNLRIDTRFYKTDNKRKFLLDSFNITGKNANMFQIGLIKKTPMGNYYNEPDFNFHSEIFKLPKNTYINGYWQSEKYFKDISDIISKEFTPKNPLPEHANAILNQIKNSNSVSVHVRRTDYLEKQSTYEILGRDYYNKAFEKVAQKINEPKYFFFSDDIEWVKKNISHSSNDIFVSDEIKLQDFEELVLMSECKHNIIANSSFSWWAAWLNRNPNKVVIGPTLWLKDKSQNNDRIPDNWIKI